MGLKGMGIANGANKQMTAVITPIRVNCFVVINECLEDVCSILRFLSNFKVLQKNKLLYVEYKYIE